MIETRRALGSVDPLTCLRIQCGQISQAEAGMTTLYACSAAGYAGVYPWSDPHCAPIGGGPPPATQPPATQPPATPPPATPPPATPPPATPPPATPPPATQPPPANYPETPETEIPTPETDLVVIGTPGQIAPIHAPARPGPQAWTAGLTDRLKTVPWWIWLLVATLIYRSTRK